ncbi:MAG TPA: DUF3857 and transglutaminase domain-containing protein [Longimicrobium sp.]|jgi:hypothetical protein|uniref:DUF3857 domain-containing transglutaminase family protein n=1 Tax=Longimicrobium sp. TaxID=2029185 RepID=UPI002EDA2556
MRHHWITLGLLLAAAPLAAQAPRITEAGDPSVRSDTIYRLAVKAQDYPEESSVLLLDDGVVVVEADGRGSRTYRTVAQVLTQEAVESLAENTFSWDGRREKFRLNWARVIGPDGRVVSDKPSHDQESTSTPGESAPVYTDQRIRRITMGGVVPGMIVDYSYTVETLEPVLPGDFLAQWSVHTGRPTLRSRYLLEIPSSVQPRILEHNLNFARRTRTAGGRTLYNWSTRDVAKVEPEPFMARDSNRLYMNILVTGPTTWADVARWYHGLSANRYEVTPELRARMAEVVRGARTREDSLRALHRWIAQDIRYVSLSLGIGGYQPRTPAQVLETQYGDCKDKATLFVALARSMGVKAYPVILSSGGGVRRDMPSVEQFDHMIAAVERPEGGYTYLDLTAELIPYGEVSPGYQGEFGLVVKQDGTAEEITFPLNEPSANRSESLLAGELDAQGLFRGQWMQRATGSLQYELRSAFANPFTPKDREEFSRAIAGRVFTGAVTDSVRLFNGRDLTARPELSVWLSRGRAATRSGGDLILTLPMANGSMDAVLAEIAAAPTPRRTDIDLNAVMGPVQTLSEFRVALPEGYRARLPQGVRAESEFGSYVSEYVQEGQTLRVTRRFSGYRGTAPGSHLPALVAWFEALNRDDARLVVLEAAK